MTPRHQTLGGSAPRPLIIPLLASTLLLTSCSHEQGAADLSTGSDLALATDALEDCPGPVLTGEVTNARALGGQALSSGQQVACGQILRGGQLSQLSAACGEFAALGVKTVIDLRQSAVQTGDPPPACVQGQAAVVAAPLPKLLPPTTENYLALLEETAGIAAVFSALGQAGSYPVYIHCVIGRDRASFITALVLLALGAERQTVIDEFMLSNAAGVTVQEEWIAAVLDEVQGRGGIEAFLDSCGVTASQIAALRAQAQRQ